MKKVLSLGDSMQRNRPGMEDSGERDLRGGR